MVTSPLVAGDALTRHWARVNADDHPSAAEPGLIYAVFGEESGDFLGLVNEHQISRYPQRIFADLANLSKTVTIPADTPLDELDRHFAGGEVAVAVTGGDRIIGAVTQASLLHSLVHWYQRASRQLKADQARQARWSRRLTSLNDASQHLLELLAHTQEPHELCQRGIEILSSLVEARYGAIAILDAQQQLQDFVQTGISEAQVTEIGAYPTGKGLLGDILHSEACFNIANIEEDPRFTGFPPHHPIMKSMLACPVTHKDQTRGRVYLCDKLNKKRFTTDDEIVVQTFANTLALILIQAEEQQARFAAEQHALKLLGENQALTRKLITGIEQDRQRIAKELHDEMAQYCAAVLANAHTINSLNQNTHSAIAESAKSIIDLCEHTHHKIEAVINELKPPLLDSEGLEVSLHSLLDEWRRYCPGIQFRLVYDPSIPRLGRTLEIALYRIIQESLSNIARHSQAEWATIQLDREGTNLRLEIKDNGQGAGEAQLNSGFGLAGMRERVFAMNGDIKLQTQPAQGFALRIELPLSEPY